MPSYTDLSIWKVESNEDFHINYFRTYIRPGPGRLMPSGGDLLANMSSFMDADTAKVWVGPFAWRGQRTLMFRGKATFRPFAVPVMLPGFQTIWVDMPSSIRTMMIPQVHTDSVGLPLGTLPHSFTVQTLKREFETGDDSWIRGMIGQRVASANPDWKEKAVNFLRGAAKLANPIYGAADDASQALATLLGNYAVMINQHHFLAGRRSFLMKPAGYYGALPTGVQAGDWAFETAAVERYSLRTFRYATNYAIGGAPGVVRPVWVEMGQRLARFYGQPIGQTIAKQHSHTAFVYLHDDIIFQEIMKRHVALLP